MNKKIAGILLLIVFTGCETMQGWAPEPEEKTKIGAMTGGVVGAGLGAIVGSQTGSAGGGMAIGALAGAGTGAAIGNVFEQQDAELNQQDEVIRRQDETIAAHKREIEGMRGGRGDYARSSSSGAYRSPSAPYASGAPAASASGRTYPYAPSASTASRDTGRNTYASNSYASASKPRAMVESNLVEPKAYVPKTSSPLAAAEPNKVAEIPAREASTRDSLEAPALAAEMGGVAAQNPSSESIATAGALSDNNDCSEAQKEAAKGDAAGDGADQLFHYRRALRLCPNDPVLHNSLGKTYAKLQRKTDAEFEFNEALNLNPSYDEARQNLNSVRAKG